MWSILLISPDHPLIPKRRVVERSHHTLPSGLPITADVAQDFIHAARNECGRMMLGVWVNPFEPSMSKELHVS